MGEDYFVEALKHSEEVLGEDHSQTVVSLRNLSSLYKQTNRSGSGSGREGVAWCVFICMFPLCLKVGVGYSTTGASVWYPH